MKKTTCLFICMCVMAFCFTACAGGQAENESPLTSRNSGVDTNTPHDPPRVLTFKSFEEIAELNKTTEQEENVVIEYLESHTFNMNGLSSKADVVALFDQIGDLEVLHLKEASAYRVVDISYYVDYGYVMFTYRNIDNLVRFICYIGERETADQSSERVIATEIEKLTIENVAVSLYEVDTANGLFDLTGELNTSNSRITILLSSDESNGVRKALEQNLVQITLQELIEQK